MGRQRDIDLRIVIQQEFGDLGMTASINRDWWNVFTSFGSTPASRSTKSDSGVSSSMADLSGLT